MEDNIISALNNLYSAINIADNALESLNINANNCGMYKNAKNTIKNARKSYYTIAKLLEKIK